MPHALVSCSMTAGPSSHYSWIPALVLNPDKTPDSPNWVPGLHLIWAEHDTDRPRRWTYCHAQTKADWTNFYTVSEETFPTKDQAIRACVNWVKMAYPACDAPSGSYHNEPGPFRMVQSDKVTCPDALAVATSPVFRTTRNTASRFALIALVYGRLIVTS